LDLIIHQFGKEWLLRDYMYGDAWNTESILHLASDGREVESRIALRMAELSRSEAYLNDGANIHSRLGYLYYGRREFQTALEYYWKAVRSANQGDDYRMLSVIYGQLGDNSSIERVGRVAIENGQDEWGYYILGSYYARIGNLDEAERYLKDVLAQQDIGSYGLLPWYAHLDYASVKKSQGDLSTA
jgi:tetratricopeptide (TPR) repeat protein